MPKFPKNDPHSYHVTDFAVMQKQQAWAESYQHELKCMKCNATLAKGTVHELLGEYECKCGAKMYVEL